jgi:hypothetical protein
MLQLHCCNILSVCVHLDIEAKSLLDRMTLYIKELFGEAESEKVPFGHLTNQGRQQEVFESISLAEVKKKMGAEAFEVSVCRKQRLIAG